MKNAALAALQICFALLCKGVYRLVKDLVDRLYYPDHMPSAHRRYAAWSPARFQCWARSIGDVLACLSDGDTVPWRSSSPTYRLPRLGTGSRD
jgi:hypothetical protein